MLHALIRVGAIVPSGSSKEKTRDKLDPGVKKEGHRTHKGNWQTLRWRKREGLLSRRTCQQMAGECMVGCPSTTLVGTELISTLPHLTFRWAEMQGSSGKALLIAELIRGVAE